MKRLLTLLCGIALWGTSASAQLTEQQQIQKLNYAYQYIRNNYVDDVPLEPLVEEAIIATLKELDPHSTYLTQEQMTNLRTRLRGEFAGIGIRYIMHNDTIVVRSITPHSPAERANIRLNDRIISIDNLSAVGLSTDSAAMLLRGDADTQLSFSIIRRGEPNKIDISLQRKIIETSAISASMRIGDVGYIRATSFSKPLASEFLSAYKQLGKIKSLVIDLRDNGGGAITSAIDLSGLFLRKGDVIVSTEGRTNSVVYDKKRDGEILDIPIVVIINESSASASEIFAGAIQDHDRGVIIGHTSFGKGLVQRVIDLKDGTGMCLTTTRYKTPSGRTIQRPYTMGKGEEYMSDSMRFMHPDSIAHDPSLMFTTLKRGRKVYGGGGITPDVYINTDSITLSPRLAQLHAQAIFEHTAVEIWDRFSPHTLREQYPTVEEFNAKYEPSEQIYELFYSAASSTPDDFTEIDHKFIRTMILATMAEQIYQESARQYIYGMNFDYMMQRALNIATNNSLYTEILENAN